MCLGGAFEGVLRSVLGCVLGVFGAVFGVVLWCFAGGFSIHATGATQGLDGVSPVVGLSGVSCLDLLVSGAFGLWC